MSKRSGPPGILGAGINVAVVDSGLDSDHEDLSANVETTRNHNYLIRDGGDTTGIYNSNSSHGTAVAGIIAARDNGLGVRGVAPRATIYGYNLLRDRTDGNTADAMKRKPAGDACLQQQLERQHQWRTLRRQHLGDGDRDRTDAGGRGQGQSSMSLALGTMP